MFGLYSVELVAADAAAAAAVDDDVDDDAECRCFFPTPPSDAIFFTQNTIFFFWIENLRMSEKMKRKNRKNFSHKQNFKLD